MRVPWPLLLASLAPMAQAQVYQSVDPDGRPVFTDRPSPEARTLDIPLRRAGQQDAAAVTPRRRDAGFPGPYEMLEIVAPGDEHRTRHADGELPVSLVISPALMEDHRLLVEVNGRPAEGDLPNPTQVLLRGLALGTHRIQGIVQDADGTLVAATPPVNVHVLPPVHELPPLPDSSAP